MSNNSFDEIRENVLQTAQEHYDKNNPEYTAFIAGAGYVLSQQPLNMGAYKQGKTVSEVEVRHYTQDTEDEVAQWIVDKTQYTVAVAIVGETLYFDDQTAQYGDSIVYSADDGFTVHSGNSPKD